MDGCPQLLDQIVPGTNFTWTKALSNKVTTITSTSTYLRPNVGAALMPWVYILIVIILHLPMVIIRVTRWEIVQVWSIVSTAFTVILFIQAYVSTRFESAQILLWSPLMLVIDAGSMAQIFFLVLEAKRIRVGRRVVLSESEGLESSTLRSRLISLWKRQQARWRRFRTSEEGNNQEIGSMQSDPTLDGLIGQTDTKADVAHNGDYSIGAGSANNIVEQTLWYRDPALLSASAAAVLFMAVLVLQLIGLVQAVKAYRSLNAPPSVSWCSPLLQPFGIAAVDSYCQVFPISQSGNQGIGCIEMPGVWQQQWLIGTIVVTVLELIFESVDILLLALVSTTTKFRGAKLRRPWTTIFSGLAVLGVTLIYSIMYSRTLPAEIGRRVTIAIDTQGPASYTGTFTNAGLRGTIIGWNDGLFESWHTGYFGDRV